MLKDNMDRKVNVALIPLGSSVPVSRQQHYDWLRQARNAYSLGHWELTQQTILSLESGLSGPLHGRKDMLHFRPQIAEEALGALTVRALKTMLAADSEAFPALVVASWNTKPAQVHREMLATRELCLAHTVGDLLSATLRSASFPWAMRYSFGLTQLEEPFPVGVMQTYTHDTEQEPAMMRNRYMPELIRTFCDDEAVRQTLLDHAGQYSKDLWNVLQSPARRADLFRYIYLYEHGGLYLDIKCSLRMPLRALLSHLAEEWGPAQSNALQAQGLCPTPPGQLPHDYITMAIGNRGDHVFQGIIWRRPKHPLLLEAIIQFYSDPIFNGRAQTDYLIFCKFLFRALRESLGYTPQHGWNISSRFGPVYLLREHHSKEMKDTSDIPMDGHYMITQGGRLAMFTRCWNWNRGFKGDMAAQARNESQLLRSMPEAALDAAWARGQVASPTSSAASGFEPPTAAELQQWADEAIAGNLYDKIMEALSQTHHYKDLNGNDVLNLICKGLCLSEDRSLLVSSWGSLPRVSHGQPSSPLD